MIELRQESFVDFFETPFRIYPASSPFVSVFRDDLERFLDAGKNPLWREHGARTYWTAHRDGRRLGRITVHEHITSNRLHGWRRAFFGYFDCTDDLEVARALLDAAEAWGRARGCDTMMGRFDLTAMQQIGVVTDGFAAAPYSDQVWTPPHLPGLLTSCGYTATFPMTSFDVDLTVLDPDAIVTPRHRALFSDPAFTWETLHRRRLAAEIPEVCDVLNDGFVDNPMFVPLTQEEFAFQAKDLSLIIDERISSVVRHQGRMLGALIAIPDLNPLLRASRSRLSWRAPFLLLAHRLRRRRAVAIFQSVRRDWHQRGLGAALIYRAMGSLKAAGYERLGITWVSDDNGPSLAGVRRIGGRPMHRLHLFTKALR